NLDWPGMPLVRGPERDSVAAAGSMFSLGARYVRLITTVELDSEDPNVVTALSLVRELTSYGIAVDWKINLGAEPGRWLLLSHLYPPRLIVAASSGDAELETWRNTYHLAKFGYRRGPNFIQIRDYRTGTLKRHVIRIRDHDESFSQLLTGVAGTSLSRSLTDTYHREGLIIEVGGKVLWLPYRIRAWPLSPLMV
ncbi:MAG: DUF5825 family protein, partial [Frankia sp.]